MQSALIFPYSYLGSPKSLFYPAFPQHGCAGVVVARIRIIVHVNLSTPPLTDIIVVLLLIASYTFTFSIASTWMGIGPNRTD